MTLYELIKKAIPTGISKSIGVSGAIVLQLLLARNLSVTDVGVFVTVITFLMAVSVLVRFGVETVILRYGGVYYFEGDSDKFANLMASVRSYILKRGFTAILICSVAAIVAYQWNFTSNVKPLVLSLTVMLIPFYSLLLPMAAAYRAKDQPIRAPLWEQGGVSLLVSLILLPAWLFYEAHIEHAVIIFALVTLVLLFPVVGLKASSKKIDLNAYDGITDYGVSQVATFATQWGVLLVLSAMGDQSEVAYLSTALRVVMVVNFVLIIFNGILAPRFASLHKAGKADDFKRLAKRATVLMSMVAAVPAIFLLVNPEWILSWFGDEYKEAAVLLMILAAAQFYNVLSGSVLLALNMSGNQRDVRNMVVISGLLSLVLVGPVVYYGGALYAAILIALINVLTNTIAQFAAHRRLGFTTLPI